MRIKVSIALYISFLFLLPCTSKGQLLRNYSFTTDNTSALANNFFGTAVSMSSSTTLLIGPGAIDITSGMQTLPFDFWFMGTRYTSYSVNTRGVFSLGTLVPGNSNFLASGPRFSIFNGNDFLAQAAGISSTGKIHCKTFGTVPNRTFIIEWKNVSVNALSGTADATCQIRLYEKTGGIEFIYGAMSVGSGATTIHPGINSGSSSYLSIDVAAGTATENILKDNVFSAGTMTNLNSSNDATRRAYRFIPKYGQAPTNLAVSSIAADTAVVSWIDNETDEIAYELYASTDDGTTWSLMSSIAANQQKVTLRGLTYQQKYKIRLHPLLETIGDYDETEFYTSVGSTKYAVKTGNWSDTATWNNSTLPSKNDVVVIPNVYKVTIDMKVTCRDLIVGQGSSGILEFNGSTADTLKVSGKLLIQPGAQLVSAATGTVIKHLLIVEGDVYNNGYINLSNNNAQSAVVLSIQGANNSVYSSSSTAYANFYAVDGLIIDKTVTTAKLQFTPNGSYQADHTSAKGFLKIIFSL